jgi:serine/threonine protein kinase
VPCIFTCSILPLVLTYSSGFTYSSCLLIFLRIPLSLQGLQNERIITDELVKGNLPPSRLLLLLTDLLMWMLDPDVTSRASVREALSHPVFNCKMNIRYQKFLNVLYFFVSNKQINKSTYCFLFQVAHMNPPQQVYWMNVRGWQGARMTESVRQCT